MKVDDMPRARPEFVRLSEAEVWKAMGDGTGGAIEAEVTRLVAAFTVCLMACAERQGQAVGGGMVIEPRCPIERVALLVMAEGGASVSTVH